VLRYGKTATTIDLEQTRLDLAAVEATANAAGREIARLTARLVAHDGRLAEVSRLGQQLGKTEVDNQRISDAWAEVVQREQRAKNADFYDQQQRAAEAARLTAERDAALALVGQLQEQLDAVRADTRAQIVAELHALRDLPDHDDDTRSTLHAGRLEGLES
jgi:hypothetical protein